jgi:hypothetical protein
MSASSPRSPEVLESGMLTMGPKGLSSRRSSRRLRRAARSPSPPARRRCTWRCLRSRSRRATKCSCLRTRSPRLRRRAAGQPSSSTVDPDTMNTTSASSSPACARRRSSRSTCSAARHVRGPARRAAGARDAAGALGRGGGAGLRWPRPGRLPSFHPRKIVTTGEGGAVTTNDDAIAESVAAIRNHGWRSPVPPTCRAWLQLQASDLLRAVASRRWRASMSGSPSGRDRRWLQRALSASRALPSADDATSTAGRPT